MKFEDLEAARAKRAKKETIKEVKGKGKRGRKLKSAPLEIEEATVNKEKRGTSGALELDTPEPTAKVARISGTQVVEDATAPEP